jgi:replicative DNA helicase
MQRLRLGKVAEEHHGRLAEAAGALNRLPFFIDDQPVARMPEIRAKIARGVQRHGLRVVAVDYLQLIEGRGDEESRRLEIEAIGRGLKHLAVKLNIPIIALAQLSRAVEARSDKRPKASDLRESGSLEQDADVILMLYRPEVYAAESKREELEGKAELIIAKQRNGPTGMVPLYFQRQYTRFDQVMRPG